MSGGDDEVQKNHWHFHIETAVFEHSYNNTFNCAALDYPDLKQLADIDVETPSGVSSQLELSAEPQGERAETGVDENELENYDDISSKFVNLIK